MNKKKALISVSDKNNLKKLLTNLKKHNIEIISSGGTYRKIIKLGFKCSEVSDYTGTPEILDGRVKTLHPKIHAGILSNRSKRSHKATLKKLNFHEIDFVIVNFYPFEKTLNYTNNFDDRGINGWFDKYQYRTHGLFFIISEIESFNDPKGIYLKCEDC